VTVSVAAARGGGGHLLAGAGEHDADAVDAHRPVLANEPDSPASDGRVDAAPLDRAATARPSPRRHEPGAERFMRVQYAAAGTDDLRHGAQSLTEAVGQVALGAQTATLAGGRRIRGVRRCRRRVDDVIGSRPQQQQPCNHHSDAIPRTCRQNAAEKNCNKSYSRNVQNVGTRLKTR